MGEAADDRLTAFSADGFLGTHMVGEIAAIRLEHSEWFALAADLNRILQSTAVRAAEVNRGLNYEPLISEADVEEAPDNSAQDAFCFLVTRADRKLTDILRSFDTDQDGWKEHTAAQYCFMNGVTALAKSYGIEAFANADMPSVRNFDDNRYEQFRADLDHFLTQLIVGRVMGQKRDSVAASAELRGSISTHVHHIRVAINKATVSDAKRATLLKRLTEFEAAMEKRNLNIAQVARFAFDVMTLTAAGVTVADSKAIHKLCNEVVQFVAVAKAEQNEALSIAAPPLLIVDASLPARAPKGFKPGRAPAENFDLDDEIPF